MRSSRNGLNPELHQNLPQMPFDLAWRDVTAWCEADSFPHTVFPKETSSWYILKSICSTIFHHLIKSVFAVDSLNPIHSYVGSCRRNSRNTKCCIRWKFHYDVSTGFVVDPQFTWNLLGLPNTSLSGWRVASILWGAGQFMCRRYGSDSADFRQEADSTNFTNTAFPRVKWYVLRTASTCDIG